MSIQHRYHAVLLGENEQVNAQMISAYRNALWDELQVARSREEARTITINFRDNVWFSTHTEFGHPSSLHAANAWKIANRVGSSADHWIDSPDFDQFLIDQRMKECDA